MKLVVAVISPVKFDDVKDALLEVGISGMTVSEAQGLGHENGHVEIYRGAEYVVDLVPKVRLEILAEDSQVQDILKALSQSARTGSVGDGKVWVLGVEGAARIRTGETGPDAL